MIRESRRRKEEEEEEEAGTGERGNDTATLITIKSAIVTYTRDTRLLRSPFKITSMSKNASARRAAASFG